jgi:hypothetical protein
MIPALQQTTLKSGQAERGAVTLIQHFEPDFGRGSYAS